ncbi:MliC family protein [Chromobacterium sp. IIBBL 290-4]|uniref:MliC family protein n=1 Tax=Chromobacterium sp. IIBBL 290-4 TaxID=2953890 RepID=UPI0020B8EEFD|nr:MliC family protein [Chromobacterium sp. IIBBL 290-4]UTH76058.1 MliC family protein [Chromobacterium sp. IIBBL 290-4]
MSIAASRLIGLLFALPVLAFASKNDHLHANGSSRPSADAAKSVDEAPAALPPVATDFHCDQPANQVESMVCQDDGLTRLDNRLEKVYAQALAKAEQAGGNAYPKLISEQKRWVKNLKDCLKNEDPHMCLGDTYILHISQLQAAWNLAPSLTPLRYLCKGGPSATILATFYRTHPATAKLERGNTLVIVHQGLSGSGARYLGQGIEFWIKGRDASVNWRGEQLECSSQPTP